MQQPIIYAKELNMLVYSWDATQIQVDVILNETESICIACFTEVETAVKFMYQSIVNHMKALNKDKRIAKVNHLLNLASNQAAYLGEIQNCVRLSAKLLNY